jgi:hypothetical protein
VLYLLFIVWWDPFEPKWFVIPNLGLWTVLAVTWDARAGQWHRLLVFGALVAIIGWANLSATIWRRHCTESSDIQRAACVASHLGTDDLLVSLEWNWAPYLPFFQRDLLSVIGHVARQPGPDAALERVAREIQSSMHAGRRVFMREVGSLSDEHLHWLARHTGVTQGDLQQFEGVPAFECGGLKFQEITGVPLDPSSPR